MRLLIISGGLLATGSFLLTSLSFVYGEKLFDQRIPTTGLTILGLLGTGIFIVSLFIWSFSQTRKIKRIMLICLGVLLLALVFPLTSRCPALSYDNNPMTYDNDVVSCEIVFPYQPFYWAKAFDTISGKREDKGYDPEGGFTFFAGANIVREEYSNFIWSLRRAVK